MKEVRFQFSLTGLFIGLIVVSMFAGMFGLLIADMGDNYGDYSANNTFVKYRNYSDRIENLSNNMNDDIKLATGQSGDSSFVDIVGAVYRTGANAVGTGATSFSIITSMVSDASDDIPEVANFNTYILAILLAIIIIGIIVTALVKMRL
jgi:hypothetical protein